MRAADDVVAGSFRSLVATFGFLGTLLLVAVGARGAEGTLAETAERVRAAKTRDAALRSIEGAVESLEAETSTAEEQSLEMLADPARHRTRTESERALRAAEEDRLRQAFRRQLMAFSADRGSELSREWVDDVMAREHSRIDTTIDRLLDAYFERRYEEARKRAVRMQRGQLDEIVYPDGAEIEALAGPPTDFVRLRTSGIADRVRSPNGRALVDGYVAEVAAGDPLFEENEAIVEKRTQRAIQNALVLLWRQLRLVARAAPDEGMERSVIVASIGEDLQRLATEAEQVSGTSYGVFAAAEQFAAERAEALEIKAFASFLQEQLDPSGGCPALPAERVLREVPSSYDQVPTDLATHEEELQDRLAGPTEAHVLDVYASELADPTIRASFQERLRELLEQEPRTSRAFVKGFTACIRRPLTQRREELAAKELGARVPAIADYSFELSDAALQAIESAPLAPLDPSLFPGPEALQMEETRTAYDAHEKRLRSEAKDVLWRQGAVTRNPERKASFVERIEADQGRSDDRKAYWQREYEASVLEAWRQVRRDDLIKDGDGNPYHPEKYDRVFGPVSEIIEEIITLEFGRVETQVAETEPTPQQTPGQPTPRVETEPVPQAPGQEVASAPQSPHDARNPGGLGGPVEGPKDGTATGPRGGGGGGGGAADCVPLLEQCSGANRVCYDALTQCKKDPATCDTGIARCRAEKARCEDSWKASPSFEFQAWLDQGTMRASALCAATAASSREK
jgi:hypothetical protein